MLLVPSGSRRVSLEREASVVRTVLAYLAVQRASESTRRRPARRQSEIADVLDQAREWLENRASVLGTRD